MKSNRKKQPGRSPQSQAKSISPQNTSLFALIRGIGVALAITIIVLIVTAVLLTYTDISEEKIPIISSITTVLSCIIGGFISAKGAENRGLMWGAICGTVYAAIFISLGISLGGSGILNVNRILAAVMAMGGGAIGGIIGINKKR